MLPQDKQKPMNYKYRKPICNACAIPGLNVHQNCATVQVQSSRSEEHYTKTLPCTVSTVHGMQGDMYCKTKHSHYKYHIIKRNACTIPGLKVHQNCALDRIPSSRSDEHCIKMHTANVKRWYETILFNYRCVVFFLRSLNSHPAFPSDVIHCLPYAYTEVIVYKVTNAEQKSSITNIK